MGHAQLLKNGCAVVRPCMLRTRTLMPPGCTLPLESYYAGAAAPVPGLRMETRPTCAAGRFAHRRRQLTAGMGDVSLGANQIDQRVRCDLLLGEGVGHGLPLTAATTLATASPHGADGLPAIARGSPAIRLSLPLDNLHRRRIMATSVTTGATTLDESAVQGLAAAMRGRLVQPDDHDYDEARPVYNAMIDKRPALIARCANVADVIAAVNFARDHEPARRHPRRRPQRPGLGTVDDGLVIDLSLMNGVRVDPGAHRPRRGRRAAGRPAPRHARLRAGHSKRHHLHDRRRRHHPRRRPRPPHPPVRPGHRQPARG